jgi:hypothetical protein
MAPPRSGAVFSHRLRLQGARGFSARPNKNERRPEPALVKQVNMLAG